MKTTRPARLSTSSVWAGEAPEPLTGCITTPIYQTSTFAFRNLKHLRDYLKGKEGIYHYTRYGNPTTDAAVRKIAALEGGEAGLVFSSGMAAIATTILALVSSGDEVLSVRNLYGGTLHFFQDLCPRLGIGVKFVDAERIADMRRLVTRRTKLLYLESPTNPTLKLVDIREAVGIARKHRLLTLIDNTFATPVNQRPIEAGVDVVLHSGTKYLGGHNDLLAGAVVGKKPVVRKIWDTYKILGGVPDPFAGFLLLRGMKTLALRMEQHNANALAVAHYLERHPKAIQVSYPGLASHPQHDLAKRQMKGFGGVVTFEVAGGLKAAGRVFDRFKLIKRASTLGGVESLALIPVLTSQWGFSRKELDRIGVREGMVRLSIGIEDIEDILGDLEQALR
jgi:cystathionine beta-lyase/cystathionine gamma-synthase